MDIGKVERIRTVEPIFDPIPRETPAQPEPARERPPVEQPEEVPA